MGEKLLCGFALDRKLEKHSPAKASTLIGILWAGRHLPVLHDNDVVSILATLVLVFLLSYVFTGVAAMQDGRWCRYSSFTRRKTLPIRSWPFFSDCVIIDRGIVSVLGTLFGFRFSRNWDAAATDGDVKDIM